MIKSKSEWNDGRVQEYVRSGYGRCPLCKSREVTGGSVNTDGKLVWQTVGCDDCNAEWDDVYELAHIDIKSFGNLEFEVSLGGN